MKRICFAVSAVVLSVALIELTSFAVLSYRLGRWCTMSGFQDLAEAVRDDVPAWQPAAVEEKEDHPWWYASEVVHPYLGYVLDRDRNRTTSLLQPLKPRPGSPPVRKSSGDSDTVSRDFTNFGFFQEPGTPLFNQPSSDLVVIGIFGGSVAELFYVRGRKYLNECLAVSEPFRDKNLLMLPFALGGYKQPQHLMALSYLLVIGVHLDVVLLVDGFNELGQVMTENRRFGVYPTYPRAWYNRSAAVTDQSRILAGGRLAVLQDLRREWVRWSLRAPWRWSCTMHLVWHLIDAGLTRRVAAAVAECQQPDRMAAEYVRTGPWYDYSDTEQVYTDLAAHWQRASKLMHGICARYGIEYYHFLQPNQYVPDGKPLTAVERRMAYNAESELTAIIPQGYPYLRRAGEELVKDGVHFTDLSMVFSGCQEALYIDSCCHFNDRGNELMARAVAAAMLGPRPAPE
ncbi:hypothetical protein JW905_02020 [bacterium]|nr:hypothetical protein [candidate division CSSED10-310 bacterium]